VMFKVSTGRYAGAVHFCGAEELMDKMSWTQRWFRRAAIPTSGHSAAETAPSDEPDVRSGRQVPGGFHRPPVDPAGRLVRSGRARSFTDPAGRLVPTGFRRPPVDPAGRLGRLAGPPARTDDAVPAFTGGTRRYPSQPGVPDKRPLLAPRRCLIYPGHSDLPCRANVTNRTEARGTEVDEMSLRRLRAAREDRRGPSDR